MGSGTTCVAFFAILSEFSRIVNEAWVPQPKTNVWLPLAKAIYQSTLCISMTSPSDPFQTCLVGIPLTKDEWNKLYNQTVTRDCTTPGKHRSSWSCLGSRQSDAGQSVGWYLGNANGGMRKISNFPALTAAAKSWIYEAL